MSRNRYPPKAIAFREEALRLDKSMVRLALRNPENVFGDQSLSMLWSQNLECAFSEIEECAGDDPLHQSDGF